MLAFYCLKFLSFYMSFYVNSNFSSSSDFYKKPILFHIAFPLRFLYLPLLILLQLLF